MKIVVTGAAGFIGSVVAELLVERGHQVVAVDDLRYGHRTAVDPKAEFRQVDITDPAAVEKVFEGQSIEAVVHLAAESYVNQSITDGGKFYKVNVSGGLNLLDSMRRHGVDKFILSSTAAVYGEPKSLPIFEDSPREPVNAYGETKLAFEGALKWYRRSYGLKHVSLRYFNACGATALHGEDRVTETHLIPLLLQVVQGRRENLSLFGDDYPTKDGTCVRDYVHVYDIAQAHILALDAIDEIGANVYNLGTEVGNSNLEVFESVRRVTGHPVPMVKAPRRDGDPATLVASSAKIREQLGWTPRYPDLESMVQSAWDWRVKFPNGYGSN